MIIYTYTLVIDNDGNDFFSVMERDSITLSETDAGWYDNENGVEYPRVPIVIMGDEQDIVVMGSDIPVVDAEEILGDAYDSCESCYDTLGCSTCNGDPSCPAFCSDCLE